MFKPGGLVFQDRVWHKDVFFKVATGEEIVDWIFLHFIDAESRADALEIGNTLILGLILEHVKFKQTLLGK